MRSLPSAGQKIIVLGVDGMDPRLLTEYMNKGWMPNCKRLMQMGGFSPIGTSDPPQSPVAWSNFISGTNPGGHGIFDFISRDAESMKPFLSTSRTTPPSRTVSIGKFNIPLSGAQTQLLREGPTLWELLEQGGVPSTAFKVPVNFPPTPSRAQTVSGITTPDIHGSYGIFSFYSNDPAYTYGDVAGGSIQRIRFRRNRAECVLRGPSNLFKIEQDDVNVPFTVEQRSRMALIRIQDHEILLRDGEWSDWRRIEFTLLPYLANVNGICRFYLKKTDPYLELYVSPVNIDPADPTMPISTPDSYARQLVQEVGPFYTQGMPEDTAALSAGIFDDDDFRAQSTFVLEERMRFFEHQISHFNEGFLYFYFSSLDLDSHAFWRAIDPEHPLYTPELAEKQGDYIPWLYTRIDGAVGKAMQHIDEKTLLFVVSDHGFVSFRRQFNLNSWLMDNGYAVPRNRHDRGQGSFFANTRWGRTQAYGLGINSLYLNVKGREPNGVVAPGDEYEKVRTNLIGQLMAVRDPQTGEKVISHVYRPQDIYDGPYVDRAPDLVVCYNRNYRASWDTILGGYPKEVITDNLDPWSGDHCMDAQFLPGVLLCNRPWQVRTPTLSDMAPTILSACRLRVPSVMTGRNIFAS